MARVRAALAVCLVVFLSAGCGSGAAPITAKELPTLVLQPRDLSAAFERFDEGAQASLDRVPGPRFDTTRFGREGGWKARYQRAGTASTPGPLVVESRADVFAHSSGAGDDLAAYRDQFAHSVGAHLLHVPVLGDEAVAMTQLRAGTPRTRTYSIAWRVANATGSVTANGFDGRFTFAQAIALARAAERHMARAAA